MRREISVKPGQSLSEEKIEDDRRKILKLYQDRNYSDVDVQYKVEDLPDNKARVIFSITEGPKLIVKKITFIGNYSVKDKDLRGAMKTKVQDIIWFFDKRRGASSALSSMPTVQPSGFFIRTGASPTWKSPTSPPSHSKTRRTASKSSSPSRKASNIG